jgi:hypothetical protein
MAQDMLSKKTINNFLIHKYTYILILILYSGSYKFKMTCFSIFWRTQLLNVV